MAGIYIHIPFCKQPCHYCDFHFSTSVKNKKELLDSLKKEIFLRKDYLSEKKIDTVYFGGGTPSLLSKGELLEIFSELSKYYSIEGTAEITLEANPDDLTKDKLKGLSHTPINRLSICIQSFSDDDLKFLNRPHNSKVAKEVVKKAQDIGYNNITVDLIYGIHTLSNDQWKKNIEEAFLLNVQHLSCYSLTVEPKTALASFIKKGTVQNISSEKSSEQFETLIDKAVENGFIHYEISNFCKEGFHSKHNSGYWRREEYLGLGPSAHSFDGVSRQWNISSNAQYITSLKSSIVSFEKEILSEYEKYNEYILTSLRTMWGINAEFVENEFSAKINSVFLSSIVELLKENLLSKNGNTFTLTRRGKLFADKIASELFMV